jgi:RNA recognition motif-containing protein
MLTFVLLSHLHFSTLNIFITVTRDEFRTFFQQFGNVLDSVIMFDRETQRSRGFGFVTFEDPESAAHVLSMGNEQNVQQQDNDTNNDPPVARLVMRGKKIEAKAAEPKSQRRYDENPSHSRGRPPFPSSMNPNTMMMMMMYGPNDPNLYYSNALGQYYAPHSYAPPPFGGYMAPMYYPEQVPQYYPPVMPMVEGYPQYPPMDAAYGYVAMPPIYEQPYGPTSGMQSMAPDIPVNEVGVEVEGSTAVTQ